MLFLREIGLPKRIYEEIVTHPKLEGLLRIFGDILYMVGGSIVGAVIYTYFVEVIFYNIALIVGLLLIIMGAYLRKE
jgi:hypothetical protein